MRFSSLLCKIWIVLALMTIQAVAVQSVGAAVIGSIPSDADARHGLIYILGEIEKGDAERFRSEAVKFSSAVVALHSGGGQLGPALEIGRMLRLMSFNTLVLQDNKCASACALIWLAGARRVLEDGGLIGFHAAYRTETGVPVESGIANALIGAYITQLGFPSSTAGFVASASPTDMNWLTDEKARVAAIGFERRAPSAAAKPKPTPPPLDAQPRAPAAAAPAAATPLYRHYPATVYEGPHAEPDLSGKQAYAYRTRIRIGAQGPINFAGRYKVGTWGCGTSCSTGAIIDAITGAVSFLPHTVCCEDWPTDAGFERINTRSDSNLMVLAGQLNEAGFNGLHYFVIKEGRMSHILSRRPKGH